MMVTVKTTAATTGMATYNPIVNALMLPETFIILLVGSATIKEHFSVKLSAIKMTFLKHTPAGNIFQENLPERKESLSFLTPR